MGILIKRFLRPELLTLILFILGLMYAHYLGGHIIFKLIVDYFIKGFILVAPFIIFLLIFLATSRIIVYVGKSPAVGGRIIFYTLLFSYLAIITSLLSIYPYIHVIGEIPFRKVLDEILLYIPRVLMSPLVIAIILSLSSPLILTSLIHSRIEHIDRLYRSTVSLFKYVLYIMPFISFSLGVQLYNSIRLMSIQLVIMSIYAEAIYGALYLTISSVLVWLMSGIPVRKVVEYVFKAFIYCLPAGGSYLALPINLKVYEDVFKEELFGSLALSIGASINRSGSVGGALIVLALASLYTNTQITFSQLIMIGIILPFISLGAPGLYGGTLIIGMPIIINLLNIAPTNPVVTSSLAVFVSVLTYIQASLNTTTNGLIGMLMTPHTHE